MLDVYKNNLYIKAVFKGLRPCALGILGAAGFGIWKIILYDTKAISIWYEFIYGIKIRELIIFLVIFLAVFFFKKTPALYIGAGAVIGIVLKL
jgi:chromate transporter